MSIKLPTLYHNGKLNKLYQWDIWTEGADIVVEYGTVDGEKSLTRKTVKGKNIGKKNETTPEDQAVKEAEAQHKKKLEKKYSLTPNQAKETVFLPMLAQDYTKLYLKKGKTPEFPLDAQPKLNGVRCMAYWEDGEVKLMSRGGKPFDVQHIKEQLANWLPLRRVLDGELYVPNMSLQQINRLWKKHRPGPDGSIQLKYYVFDSFNKNEPDKEWKDRLFYVDDLIVSSELFEGCGEHLKGVPSYEINNENEIFEYLQIFEENGYEGIILRSPQGKYELGHRSRDLLKLKSFIDGEFEIVGHEEATGNDKGTVVWVCECANHLTFKVRPTGTRQERKELFDNAESYYSKMLTVKFQDFSDDAVPLFPVGIAIREEEDM